jgi:hypothetical protein
VWYLASMGDPLPDFGLGDLGLQTLGRFFAALPSAAASRVLSAIEQHPIPVHTASDRRRGGQFGAKLRKLQPYNHRLECGVIYRQAFLWGAANYLMELPHEELLIGFGVAHAARTRIGSVIKVRGDSETVSLPLAEAILLHDYLGEDERNTAVLVHNHPSEHPVLSLLSLVFGPDPLPSLTDRDFGLNALLLRLKSRLDGFAFGKIRFFVIQNDRISEFSGVNAATLLDLVRQLPHTRRRKQNRDTTIADNFSSAASGMAASA